MPRRTSFWLSLVAVSAFALVFASPAVQAQVTDDQPVKDVENSKFSTTGVVSSNAVFVRCGPGENYYPTTKLDKGAKVTVVGAKFDWLKIEPPQGSFCYVAKLYVDRHGDGKIGRVNKDSINVRAGSTLSALKIGILCELRQNEEVTIIGEEQEYFKILPPKSAYLYVNKKYVEPDAEAPPKPQVTKTDTKVDQPKTTTTDTPKVAVKPETVANNNTVTTPDMGTKPETRVDTKTGADTTAATDTPKTGTDTTAANTTTNPAEKMTGNTDTETVTKTTDAPKTTDTARTTDKPADAETLFDNAETRYQTARTQKLEDQPVAELLKEFEALSKNDSLPESMRRVADARVVQLKARVSAQSELLKLRQTRADDEQRKLALRTEQEELQKRIADNSIQVFTAVGTLQPSSLQVGTGATLYRVTDPATGRTICYIRSNDGKMVGLLNTFVGIKGPMQEEARLGARVILPTEVTPCDPGKVYQSITAQIIPPSLSPKQPAHASTDPNQ